MNPQHPHFNGVPILIGDMVTVRKSGERQCCGSPLDDDGRCVHRPHHAQSGEDFTDTVQGIVQDLPYKGEHRPAYLLLAKMGKLTEEDYEIIEHTPFMGRTDAAASELVVNALRERLTRSGVTGDA
jgi:hypothetical protein